MKVALVHDYLKEYGGAERVLEVLAEMFPGAPIYTAFYDEKAEVIERFGGHEIIPSWAQKVPGFVSKLHSPLRMLSPYIWEGFDLDDYDVVISSASWYVTKGVLTRPETLHVCYCHTPPRYLYGYETAVNWQKYAPVRLYARVINKGLREYDYLAAQRVDEFVVNSENVRGRVKKFYGREAEVIWPPIEVAKYQAKRKSKSDFWLTGGRLVGGKNFEVIVQAAKELGVKLKVFGKGRLEEKLRELGGNAVELVGHLDDNELIKCYQQARAFVAMAEDEDFGMTLVEAMAAGTPVLAYRGGGYKETVKEGKTGLFVEEITVERIKEGIEKMSKIDFRQEILIKEAMKYDKESFKRKMMKVIEKGRERRGDA